MCPESGPSSLLTDLEEVAWDLYDQTVKRLAEVNPQPLEPLTPDGSQQMALPGVPSLPSHGEMQDLEACLSWALSSLGSSGILPGRDQLFSFAQKQGVGPVACIIMPLSIAHTISLYILIASGENETVLQMLDHTTGDEEHRPTWQSTSSRMKAASEPGTSSITRGPVATTPEEQASALFTSNPDLEVPTNATSRGKKRKSRAKTRTKRSGVTSKKKVTVRDGTAPRKVT